MRKITLAIALASLGHMGTIPSAAADLQWRCAKTYTATLAEGARDAVQSTAETLSNLNDAKEYIDQAQTVVDGLKTTAVGTGSATAAIYLEGASTTLATASEAIASTGVVVVKGVAVASAAAAGTLVGQGVNWLVSLCWDPVCPIEPVNPNAESIYTAATEEEVQALVLEMITLITGGSASISDFEDAGSEGETALQYTEQGIALFLNFARGAAAASVGRNEETLQAVTDLTAQLAQYSSTISDFAAVLEGIAPSSPASSVQDGVDYINGNEFQVSYTNAFADQSADLTAQDLIDSYNTTLDALTTTVGNLGTVDYSPLVSSGQVQGRFRDITAAQFSEFVSDCGTNGSSCLPLEEISIVERLIEAAGVTLTGVGDVGASIAEYDAGDATCDSSLGALSLGGAAWKRSISFKGVEEGASTLADVLSTSVTDPLTGEVETSWMAVDLEESPVTIAAREATGSDDTGGENEETGFLFGCSLMPKSH